jgi:hypothetical protein
MARVRITGHADYNPHANYSGQVSDGSLDRDPKISTKMKPVDESEANSEIEKGELILDPITGAIHKALGKSHAKGGTPVSLKDGSFIFSDFKDLAITKDEKEKFEFKVGGKFKAKNSTPAKVLEKEVDLEHHNKMINILQDDKKYAPHELNSAKLMMLKNLEKAGQVAFLQEAKKGEQAPAFAANTAPVYSDNVDEQITQSMQYMQSGGKFLPQYQGGSLINIPGSGGRLTPEEIQKSLQNELKDTKGWNKLYSEGPKTYYSKPGSPGSVRTKPTAAQELAYANYLRNETPDQKARRQQREALQRQGKDPQYGFTRENPTGSLPRNPYATPVSLTMQLLGSKISAFAPPKLNTTSNPAGDPEGFVDSTDQSSKLSPWQKINMGIPFYRALTVKTQYPLRQHQESVIPQFENISAQPQLDANNQGYFNAAATTQATNPNQALANLQQLYGSRTDNSNKILGDIQNINTTNENNQKVLAANTLNQDAQVNRGFDKYYYDATQTAIKNRDELRQAYTQQGINNVNDTMEKKLAFDSFLNSQQQYRGDKTYVDGDGVQHYAGMPLYSSTPNFFGQSVKRNPVNIDIANYQSGLNNQGEDLSLKIAAIKNLLPNATDGDLLKYLGLKSFISTKKLGGKFRYVK